MIPLKDDEPTSSFPAVTVGLIVANVLMYFFFQHGTLSLGDPSSPEYLCNLTDFAAVPRELTDPGFDLGTCSDSVSPWLTVLTSMFMHGGLLHLGGNMLFLWIFGNNVEDALGPVKFLLWYLAGGVAAIALQTAIDTNSAIPTIGAWGAVAAVLGGYILLHPRARVVTLIFIVFFVTLIRIPAMLVLGFWFLQQVFFGAQGFGSGGGEGGGVAYFAHIGGFVFGLLTIRLLVRRRRPPVDRLGLT